MNKQAFYNFIKDENLNYFIIKTRNKEYTCNIYGVRSSKIINEKITEDQDFEYFEFDYKDEFGEFQLICDLFNFKKVTLTADNVKQIKKIAEKLQIDVIMEKINNYIKSCEETAKKFEEQQESIDMIENLFDLLFNIKEHSVEYAYNSIINSFWPETKENVQELAAFFFHVISTDSSIHPYLADLLVKLNESASENNKLNILVPFLISKFIKFLGSELNNCSFLYTLHKKGLISQEELVDIVKESIIFVLRCHTNGFLGHYLTIYHFYDDKRTLSNIAYWFFPEIMKADYFDLISQEITKECKAFIQSFELEKYIKMRDKGEPENELTMALRNDDIDTFQSIVTKNQIDIVKCNVPFNIFDKYSQMCFLDYSVFYGSLKCFKYLLLNHATITNKTFEYAIFGGNTEIIRIIDNNLKNENNGQKKRHVPGMINPYEQRITQTIKKHRNDLFDWTFEQSALKNDLCEYDISSIAQYCARNGNAHALIEIIAKGYNVDNSKILESAFLNGFYRLSLLILNVLNFTEQDFSRINIAKSVLFGNLSIVKLYLKLCPNRSNIFVGFNVSVCEDYMDIFKYFLNDIGKDVFQVTEQNILQAYQNAIVSGYDDILNYLFENYNNISLSSILSDPSIFKHAKNEVIKKIIDLILAEKEANNNSFKKVSYDFTKTFQLFIQCNREDLCQYLIDKKVYINYEKLCSSVNVLISNENMFSFFYKNSPPEIKEILLNVSLRLAIQKQNIGIITFLLNEKAPYDNALYEAVKCKNIEIVDIILNHDKSASFVNKKFIEGTVLSIAIHNKNLPIVQRLLSIPGIDINYIGSNRMTPLMQAVDDLNEEIIFAILKLHENNPSNSARNQIDEMMNKMCSMLFSANNQKALDLFKKLFGFKSIDINYYCEKFSLLSKACGNRDLELIKLLLTIDKLNVNSIDPKNGKTPLNIAIEKGDKEIISILINHPQIDINVRGSSNTTALTIACENKDVSTIDILLNDERFDPKENLLNFCFYKYNGDVLEHLYSAKSLDVNYKKYFDLNASFDSTLINAVCNKNIKKINMIIQHPTFDINKSFIQRALYESIRINNLEIFKIIFKLINNEYKNFNYDDESLFSTAINSHNVEVIKEILNCNYLDPARDNILVAFNEILMVTKQSFEIMKILYEYDQKHDHLIDFSKLLPNGKSYLTSIRPVKTNDYYSTTKNVSIPNVGQIVDFFLINGADPNMPDKDNVYPLAYAIETDLEEFVRSLLNSNKIDFSVKFRIKHDNGHSLQTYLHLAAAHSFPIFQLILEKSGIDVNATNEHGNTPLIIASIHRNVKCVTLLLKRPDIDYLHRNDDGQNALEVLLQQDSSKITDKNEFEKQIIAFLKDFMQ